MRAFFRYRDLGVAAATGGRVLAELVQANAAPEKGTGWHIHEADFHMVLMLKGWAKFMMEYLEEVGPFDFKSIEMAGPCSVPAPSPWPAATAA